MKKKLCVILALLSILTIWVIGINISEILLRGFDHVYCIVWNWYSSETAAHFIANAILIIFIGILAVVVTGIGHLVGVILYKLYEYYYRRDD